MEPRLVIFLAFTSVTLTANTLVIWFAYKAFANLTTKVTERMTEISSSDTTRGLFHLLEVASYQAVSATDVTRKKLENFEPVLAHTQDIYGYGLAKIDTKFETLCEVITEKVERAQSAILEPAEKIGTVAAGVQTVLGLASRIG